MAVEHGDLDNASQHVEEGEVVLKNENGHQLFKGKLRVHRGPPIGDWVEFRERRIALRALLKHHFEGIVPDVIVNMLTGKEKDNGGTETRHTDS